MAINNNFYITVNSLVQYASRGQAKTITDYSSFVDFGKSLSELDGGDFANSYMSAIANKIKLVIDTSRVYQGKIKSLIKGETSPEAIIEMLSYGFFEMREAKFVDPSENDNPFAINKGTVYAKYYVNDIAFQLPVSKQITLVIGAFETPEKMNTFLQNILTYAVNSIEIAKETSRRGLLASQVSRLAALGSDYTTDTLDTPAMKVKVLTMFNTIYGLTDDDALTSSNCMANAEYVKFLILVIKKYRTFLENPNELLNQAGTKTFTPVGSQKLITLDALDSAIVAFKNTFSPEATQLGEHESVAFWQSNKKPYYVYSASVSYVATDADRKHDNVGDISYVIASGKTYKCTAVASTGTFTEITDFEASTYASDPVVAILFDEFNMGQYITHDKSYAIFNPSNETTTTWFNMMFKNCVLDNAQSVVFVNA